MLDEKLKLIKALYEKTEFGSNFDLDLEKGIIAKINIDLHNNFPFSDYAQITTSIKTIEGNRFQYFIFKPGYVYKNGQLREEKTGKTVTALSLSKNNKERIK